MFGASAHSDRARDEQAERRDDHGAAAVDVAERAEHRRHRGRGQQIGRDDPGQVGDILELPADGRQRGRDDGLVERGQEHRQHQAHQDGADFAWRQRRRGRDRRRIADIDDLAPAIAAARPRWLRAMSVGRPDDGSAVRICSWGCAYCSDARRGKPRGIAVRRQFRRRNPSRGSGSRAWVRPAQAYRNRVIAVLRKLTALRG